MIIIHANVIDVTRVHCVGKACADILLFYFSKTTQDNINEHVPYDSVADGWADEMQDEL